MLFKKAHLLYSPRDLDIHLHHYPSQANAGILNLSLRLPSLRPLMTFTATRTSIAHIDKYARETPKLKEVYEWRCKND